MEKDHVAALRRAIDLVGSQAKLAAKFREFGRPSKTVSQQQISYWLTNETLIDAEWWPAFEFVTDDVITRRELRPDVFPRDHAA